MGSSCEQTAVFSSSHVYEFVRGLKSLNLWFCGFIFFKQRIKKYNNRADVPSVQTGCLGSEKCGDSFSPLYWVSGTSCDWLRTTTYLFNHGIISDISCLCKAALSLIPTSETRKKGKTTLFFKILHLTQCLIACGLCELRRKSSVSSGCGFFHG